MKLGIPTLYRYDLLEELLRSAECGSAQPSGYIVIDNGGELTRERLQSVLGARTKTLSLIRPGRNLGVAASWNLILESTNEPIVISNDDIIFGAHTFATLKTAAHSCLFFGNDWSLFMQTPDCTDIVGYYDENFWPAYYEDSDYQVRLHRAGIERHQGLTGHHHHGHASSPGTDGRGSTENRAYFRDKWNGRMLGEDPLDDFEEPWKGSPPEGWRLRHPSDNWFAEKYGSRRDVKHAVETKVADSAALE